MLKTLYKYELKKLFLSKVNLAALAVSLTVLVFLAVSSFSEGLPESGETAGITWILAAAALMILALLVPISLMFGMEGTGEMLQLVKPLSMLPYSIGKMIAVCLVIFFLAAVLFAAVTMLLSVVTQNALAVNCGLLCYLIVDLFGSVPDRFRLLQTVWNLRPNALLMNTGFVNYRLIGLAGRFFLSFEAAAAVYIVIAAAALVIGRVRYGRLQVEK